MIRRAYIVLASAGLLTACSTYQQEFRCPTPTGVACRSLQQVYKAETTRLPLPPPPDPTRVSPAERAEDWTPPVKTVWIAPYVDNRGRRHEASLLRLIVFPGPRGDAAAPEFLIPPIPETTDTGELLVPPPPPPASPATAPRPGTGVSRPTRPQGGTSPAGPALNLFTPPPARGAAPLSGFGVPEP